MDWTWIVILVVVGGLVGYAIYRAKTRKPVLRTPQAPDAPERPRRPIDLR